MIRVLDSFISDKIAAGEVIERPVSIVKELIENSIDAGSDSIIVEIRNGGKSYIRVTDNGSGIPSDEVATAFLRHATSKLRQITDLDKIVSLGFRGEALASISAVSRLTIVTRTAEEISGTRLILHGGREVSREMVGANTGTTIIVEDVFYNTPARRKFMGSDAREASVISELIQQYAICYDNIRFMLINNGVNIFTTNGDCDRLHAIRTVYPSRDYSELIHVDSDTVNGYISDPGTTKSTRRGQLFFVNGRLVSSSVIEKGIEKGYGDRVFSGYPIAILFINVDPSTVDVNVHPGKKEIKFLHKEDIIEAIASSIRVAMSSSGSIPQASYSVKTLKEDPHYSYSDDEPGIKDIPLHHENTVVSSKGPDIRSFLEELKREEDTPSIPEDIITPVSDETAKPEITIEKPSFRPFEFDELKYCGYVFNAYIIMQANDDIYILDQHAAHERIYYEKLTSDYLSKTQIPQPILKSVIINVSSDIYTGERDRIDALNRMGFDISDFGPNTFIMKGIPAYMELGEAESFASDFLENSSPSENTNVIDKLIMRSCKSAVKANEHLSEMEINDLIRQLSECINPFSCPHGRPTFIKISKYEIERSFRRK